MLDPAINVKPGPCSGWVALSCVTVRDLAHKPSSSNLGGPFLPHRRPGRKASWWTIYASIPRPLPSCSGQKIQSPPGLGRRYLCDLLTFLRTAKATDHPPCLFCLGCYLSSWIITCQLQTPDHSENSRNTLFPPPILLNPII